VSDLERNRQAIGVEYEFEGVDLDAPGYANLADSMMLRLDHDLAPGGYSWIFHTGEDTAKVGLCYIQSDSHKQYAKEGMGIDDYLEYWLERDPRFEDAERIAGKQHRGSAHIQPPGELSADSFMAIGDTVPTIDPLWGEGIHKGMKSARAAAVTADAALTPETVDTSAEEMSTYDDLWHSEVAPNMGTRLTMTELLYLAPNERYDQLMADLSELDVDTLSDINSGNVLALRNLLHFGDIPTLGKFLRQRFGV
jgi:digeranylgeranylglycerophospholipid reductase